MSEAYEAPTRFRVRARNQRRGAPTAAVTIKLAVAITLGLAAAVLPVIGVAAARAQDFAAPAPPGPDPSALAFLDRALPAAEGGARIEAASTRWFGLPELITRVAALELGWRSFRSAAGVSQTGEGMAT